MDVIDDLNAALAGKYHLEREIGAGGMAVVYLARDLRHGREVAVKVMNAELGAMVGAERFLSEISVMAGLHHPHLLPLFDSGEAAGLLYYVMPLVKGASLRTRLDRERQLPVHEAVRIAVAVAGALDHAHRHGVVHRDLKPENVLIHDGEPLVADFGIALAISRAGNDRITRTGMSIGTPQYASPEQAAADRDIDGRSDIYSLGAVLYEMLTADPPHTASTLQGVIARLMIDRPKDIRTLRESVPEYVAVAVERALEKLPADRFSTAAEFASTLSNSAHSTPVRITPLPRSIGGFTARLRDPLVAGLSGLAVVALGAVMWLGLATPSPIAQRYRSEELRLANDLTLASYELGTPLAISPDGAKLVYLVSELGRAPELYLRPFEELDGTPIPNTSGALHPSFRPDGNAIAFVAGDRLQLLRLTDGGSPRPTELAATPEPIFGTSWQNTDYVIVGQEHGGLLAVPTNGADHEPLTTPEDEAGSHRWPLVLPDGKTVLYTIWHGATETASIGVTVIGSGTPTSLGVAGTFPLGVVEGQLIYAEGDAQIMAIPIDLAARKPVGRPIPMERGQLSVAGAEKAALSPSGTLVFQGPQTNAVEMVRLTSSGREAGRVLPNPGVYGDPRISPNGNHVAFTSTDSGTTAAWVYPVGDASGRRIRLGPADAQTSRPEWSRDGRSVVFRSERKGGVEIWSQRIDGSAMHPLTTAQEQAAEGVPTPTGSAMIYRGDSESRDGANIWWRTSAPSDERRPVVTNAAAAASPALDRSGSWLAFASNRDGPFEVYLTGFPTPAAGGVCPVSRGGGTEPAWSTDGNALYYRRGNALYQVRVRSAERCELDPPERLFDLPLRASPFHRQFDVLPGGDGFLALREDNRSSNVVIVHDWQVALRERRGPID